MSLSSQTTKLITSATVLNGVGNLLVTQQGASPESKILLIAALLIAFKDSQKNPVNITPPNSISPAIDLIKEKLTAPGLPFLLTSVAYTNETIRNYSGDKNFIATCFLLYAIGSVANAHIMNNSGLQISQREKTIGEKMLSKLWNYCPKYLQTVILNPGSTLSVGTLLINLGTLNYQALSQNPTLFAFTTIGSLIMAYGIGNSLKPIFGKESHLTGEAAKLGAFARCVLGTGSIFAGNFFVGLGTLCFGGSLLKLGITIDAKKTSLNK